MGRRALPKKHREVDVSQHMVLPESLADPFDVVALFGRVAPLEIEIGSGKGLFLTNAARALPDHDFLGVEIVRSYAKFTASRLAQESLTNARILAGDGLALLRTIPRGSVSAIHVYFPDPWWKKRHRKRRVLNSDFIMSLDRLLCPLGRFHFWTDVQEYFDSTLTLMQSESGLVGPMDVESQPAFYDMDYRTHFERRVRTNGLPVYRAEYFQSWQVEFTVGSTGVDERIRRGGKSPADSITEGGAISRPKEEDTA